jgi:hypothetical protein
VSDLILLVYRSQSAAFVAGEALAVLQQEAGTEPEDIVVVTRDVTGRISVNLVQDRPAADQPRTSWARPGGWAGSRRTGCLGGDRAGDGAVGGGGGGCEFLQPLGL